MILSKVFAVLGFEKTPVAPNSRSKKQTLIEMPKTCATASAFAETMLSFCSTLKSYYTSAKANDQYLEDLETFINNIVTSGKRKESDPLLLKPVATVFQDYDLEDCIREIKEFSKLTCQLLMPPSKQVLNWGTKEAVTATRLDELTEVDWNEDDLATQGPYSKKFKREAASEEILSKDLDNLLESPMIDQEVSKSRRSRRKLESGGEESSSAMAAVSTSIQSTVQNFNSKYQAKDPLHRLVAPSSAHPSAPIKEDATLTQPQIPGSAARTQESPSPTRSAPQAKKPVVAKSQSSVNKQGPSSGGQKIAFEDDEENEKDAEGEGKKTGMTKLKQISQASTYSRPPANNFPAKLTTPSKVAAIPYSYAEKISQRTKWTLEEEEALTEAIEVYGVGNWAQMLEDTNFGRILHRRTGVNLKDKHRNMCKHNL